MCVNMLWLKMALNIGVYFHHLFYVAITMGNINYKKHPSMFSVLYIFSIGLDFIKNHLKEQPMVHLSDNSPSSEEEDLFPHQTGKNSRKLLEVTKKSYFELNSKFNREPV